MEITFPLTREYRRLLEWLAEQAREGKRLIAFAEAKEALGIMEHAALAEMLAGLKNCPEFAFPVIGAVHQRDAEAQFELDAYAPRAWLSYLEWEQNHVCPECHKPALEEIRVIRCRECGHEKDR